VEAKVEITPETVEAEAVEALASLLGHLQLLVKLVLYLTEALEERPQCPLLEGQGVLPLLPQVLVLTVLVAAVEVQATLQPLPVVQQAALCQHGHLAA
jgi:hypothetical protein